jgi:hypothetical protein
MKAPKIRPLLAPGRDITVEGFLSFLRSSSPPISVSGPQQTTHRGAICVEGHPNGGGVTLPDRPVDALVWIKVFAVGLQRRAKRPARRRRRT